MTRTLTFNTADDASGNGLAIQIQFFDPNGGNGSKQAGLDNIVLDETANIPEPSSLALLGLGGLLLLRRRRHA